MTAVDASPARLRAVLVGLAGSRRLDEVTARLLAELLAAVRGPRTPGQRQERR